MKKLLILTTSTGEGHNQAANSLKEEFSNFDYEIIKYDFFYNSSKFINKVVVSGYEVSATKTPTIYGFFYHLTNFKYMNNILAPCFKIIDKNLAKYINTIKPDIIIATHPLAINILSRLKKNNSITVPVISIITDFEAHYTYISKNIDCYITGSKSTNLSLISKGIDESKVFDYGIPVRSAFYQIYEEIVTTRDCDYFTILLMSGSMGLSAIYSVIKELVKNPRKLRLIVVCGKNQHLKNKLTKHFSHEIPNKKIHILGYSDTVSELMDASDIIISKPGGLTVTESIRKQLPLVIPFVIPGQESQNTQFLINENCAIKLKHISDVNNIVNDLMDNPSKVLSMRKNLKRLGSNYSMEKIVALADNLIKNNN